MSKWELTGRTFGWLKVIGPDVKADVGVNSRTFWYCRCKRCSGSARVKAYSLASGHTRSCGCLARPHGLYGTQVGKVHGAMMRRCYDRGFRQYADYGGRGIRVSEEFWDIKTFARYIEELGGLGEGLSIDRTNNDGNYERGNLRIADRVTQANNTRRNKFVVVDGRRITHAQRSRELGGNPSLVSKRVRRGWPIPDAIMTPVGSPRPQPEDV